MIKKYIKLLIIIFIFSLLSLSVFLQPHFVHDTYNFYANSLKPMPDFLAQGRLFTYLFTCLISIIKIIPQNIIQTFSVILGTFFLSISSCIIYSMIIKRIPKLKNKLIIIILSQMIMFNLYILEWMIFFETGIMCLGAMFSVIGTYYLIEKKNYLITTIFFILSIFCYQPSLTIGGSLIVLFYLYDNKDSKIISNIKKLILLFIPYSIALVSNYLFMKIPIFASDTRSSTPNIISNIFFIIKNVYFIIFKTFNFYPFLFIPIFTVITLILFIYYNKGKYLFNYILTLFSLWFLSVLPAIMMNSEQIYVIPRSAAFIPSLVIFGFIMIILYSNKSINNKILLYSIIIVFLVTTSKMIIIQNENVKNSTKDIQITNIILDKIEEYEMTNHKTIKKILLVKSKEVHLENKGMKYYSDVSIRALSSDWSTKAIFNYVTSRDFEFGYSDNKELFKENYANDFSLEQLKFIDNTLYIYTY